MKKLFLSLMIAFAGTAAWGQTAEEIIARMDEVMEAVEDDGMHMKMEMKIPIIGSMDLEMWTLGERSRMEGRMMGHKLVSFTDEDTEWEYDSKENTVTISTRKPEEGSDADNARMFNDITDGYSVKIKKETATQWILACKKTRENTDKDAPKNMELVVSKDGYRPVSLSTSVSGVKIVMKDITMGGVSEEFVTYDASLFPEAKIVDKR